MPDALAPAGLDGVHVPSSLPPDPELLALELLTAPELLVAERVLAVELVPALERFPESDIPEPPVLAEARLVSEPLDAEDPAELPAFVDPRFEG